MIIKCIKIHLDCHIMIKIIYASGQRMLLNITCHAVASLFFMFVFFVFFTHQHNQNLICFIMIGGGEGQGAPVGMSMTDNSLDK